MWVTEDKARRMVLKTADFKELQGAYVSPGRGWYHIYTFYPDKMDEEQLRWLPFEDDEMLVLLRLDIGAFQRRRIGRRVLLFIDRILTRFEEQGKEIILRITYDTEGKGKMHEPRKLSRIRSHMKALGPVVAAHAKAIYVVQGLFVGSWGEMHSSRYLDEDSICRLEQTWRKAAGNLPLALRTPSYCRMVGAGGAASRRIGVYNDAIMADATDFGTFGVKSKDHASWTEHWCPDDEMDFIGEHLWDVPCGGEVLSTAGPTGVKETIRQLRRRNICYLNSIYDPVILDHWKRLQTDCGGNLYDYVGSHLGYRLVVTKVTYQTDGLVVSIANRGFAPLCEVVELRLLAVRADESTGVQRMWLCDGQHPKEMDCQITFLPFWGEEQMNHAQLYLQLVRAKDGRTLRFANEGAGERLFIGTLMYGEDGACEKGLEAGQ